MDEPIFSKAAPQEAEVQIVFPNGSFSLPDYLKIAPEAMGAAAIVQLDGEDHRRQEVKREIWGEVREQLAKKLGPLVFAAYVAVLYGIVFALLRWGFFYVNPGLHLTLALVMVVVPGLALMAVDAVWLNNKALNGVKALVRKGGSRLARVLMPVQPMVGSRRLRVASQPLKAVVRISSDKPEVIVFDNVMRFVEDADDRQTILEGLKDLEGIVRAASADLSELCSREILMSSHQELIEQYNWAAQLVDQRDTDPLVRKSRESSLASVMSSLEARKAIETGIKRLESELAHCANLRRDINNNVLANSNSYAGTVSRDLSSVTATCRDIRATLLAREKAIAELHEDSTRFD